MSNKNKRRKSVEFASNGKMQTNRKDRSGSLESSEAIDHKESSKIKLIRRGSQSGLARRYTSPTIQYVLLTVCVLLAFHSVYVLSDSIFKGKIYDLRSASKWEAVSIVWASGYITCIATAVGVIPFIFVSKPSTLAVAYCNAIAGGMMVSASIGLIMEGFSEKTSPETLFLPAIRVLMGLYAGVGFVKGTSYLVEHDATDLIDTDDLNMRRVLLIMAVMFVHSFSEGVGIGVAYNSESQIGGFISATLSIHNAPEGVAIAIVLIPRGFSLLSTTLWCIFSSIPQPLMAVPAYLSVNTFSFIAPIGFGFAAGAMLYVAIYELLEEAQEVLSGVHAKTVMIVSMLTMGGIQLLLHEVDY